MCGIAGIISTTGKVNMHQLQKMTDVLIHRGPESDGFWINEKQTIGFGHRRLSIIDLTEAAAQPMKYDDRFTIIFNGEIYNYIELRSTLQQKGYAFMSNSDTEVILAAYACYGKECLQHFDGMFAFVIWDQKEQTAFGARDRFGEKPFYYYYDTATKDLIFASEMKAVWAAGVERKVNNTVLLNYITLGWVQNPIDSYETFFDNVHSLKASHYFTYQLHADKDNGLEIVRYWDIDKETVSTLNEKDAVEQFTALLNISVKRRLRSDVALGTSLSGGLDSSSIVAVMHESLDDKKAQKSFSAVFNGFEKDERQYIKTVTDKFGIESFSISPSAGDMINCFEKLCYYQEEPFQSSSIYAQYKVYELAKQYNVTVLLDGQGADEILAGYYKYYHWYWQELIQKKQWKKLREEKRLTLKTHTDVQWNVKNYLAAYLPSFTARRLERRAFVQQKHNIDITSEYFEAHHKKMMLHKPTVDKLNDILYFNVARFGLEELLRYADRNSMAHSREVRLPFLNHELVQFVFSLPSHFKIRNGFTKWILRQEMNTMLPAEIVWRKDKVGFEPPQRDWMQNTHVQDYIHESKKKLVEKRILKKEVLNKPVSPKAAHEQKNADWWYLCAAHCLK